ncbi:MAG: hypothetical protein AB7U73_00060 [Pirellulales bacterium]
MAVIVVGLAVGQLARMAYLGGPVILDDLDFLASLGLVRQGKLAWPIFVFATAGPHPIILWRIIYYLQWLAFGASPALFRVAIGGVQALSGGALFVLLDRYLTNRWAAVVGALLWTVSAIGGWDNPMSVMVGGFIAWGVLWLLLAMCCVSRLADHTGWRWPLLLAACISLTMFSWGILLAVLPALVLQYLLLEHRRAIPPRRLIGWAVAWLLPMLLVGALQVSMIIPEMGSAERQRDFSVFDIGQRVGGQLSMVAGNVFYGYTLNPDDQSLWPKSLIALALGCAVAVWVRGRALRFVLVVAAVTLVYLWLADMGGSELELANVVTSGRYLYLPTLLICTALATLVDRLLATLPTAAPAWRRIAWAAGGVLFALYAIHQHGVASRTRELFDEKAHDTTERLQAQQQLLLALAGEASAAGTTLRVPDLPVLLSPPSHVLWTVSTFEAVMLPGRLDGLEIVPVDRCTPEDLKGTLSALSRQNTAMARAWAELLVVSWDDFQALAWLSEFASNQDAPVRIFKFWMHHGDISYAIDQVQAWGIERQSPELEIVSDKRLFGRDLPELLRRLDESPDPLARTWAVSLRQLRAEESEFGPSMTNP